MKQNINIEAEGNELVLKNKAGDYVIIPKKYRTEVQGMIKDGCHGCIDNLVDTLPVMEDYAEDGSLIPNDKKKITFEHKPYTEVQDNTYVVPKIIIPLEQKKKQQFIPREQPILKADTRTEQEKKIAQEYTEAFLNPSIITQIAEGFQKPLRWLADPVKGVGDIISAVAPNSALANDLPNTNEEIFEHRKKQLNPYTSKKEKVNNTFNEATSLTNWALLNTLPVEAAVGNMIKSGKNLIKPMSKVVNKTDDVVDITKQIGSPLNRPFDIHDVRKKYHNYLVLQLEEMQLLNKEGKGNRANYRNVIGTDVVGKMHTEDTPIKEVNYGKKSIEEILFGKDYSTEKVANKGKTNNLENVVSNISNKSVFEENKLNIKSYKDEIEDLIKDFKTDISIFERTETSMKADKWLNDWFNHPETKKAFINYGGTTIEWGDILNSLENPIRSSEKWGKGQLGGAYMDVFKQASIPIDAKVDVGVHEGVHKTGLLTKKSNPILNNLWNDFTDAVREIPAESYPEIFRLRYNMGLKPGQKIDMKTLEKGLETISNGYSIPYKIKDKNKLLEIINKAPALIPFLGTYLQSQNQNKTKK